MDQFSWGGSPGAYKLQVTAFESNSRRGDEIATETIEFFVDGPTPEPFDSDFLFSFVDTDDNTTVTEFSDGDRLYFDEDTPPEERGIAVSYVGDGVADDDDGAIAFRLLNGAEEVLHEQFERAFPFALFGDRYGDYSDPDSILDAGEYELEVIAYAGNARNSDILATERIAFSIGDEVPKLADIASPLTDAFDFI